MFREDQPNDLNELKREMEDYYGSAMFCGFPAAVVDLAELEYLDDEQLLEKAEELGLL